MSTETITTSGPVKNLPSPAVLPVEKVDGKIIAEATTLFAKLGGARKDTTVKRADLPGLILACCLDDNKPETPIAAIKAISKINRRCTQPISSEEIAELVDATNGLISDYHETRDGEAKQKAADKKRAPDVVMTRPVKGTSTPLKAVDIVNANVISDALVKANNVKNDTPVTRANLPKLILACCLGDDNKPRDVVPSIKAITKINDRCDEPITADEIAALVDETNELIYNYIDSRDDAIKQRAAEKKVLDQKRAQADRDAAAKREVKDVDPEVLKIAKETFEKGKFLQYCQDTFSKVWLGDAHILMGVLLTVANMRVLNATDGIHLHIAGQTQSGKSDSVKAAIRFVHAVNKMIKSFSAKYLFYADDDLPACTLVFSDDTTFDPETAGLYRNMLTSWFTGVTRGIVVNFVKKDTHIPERVSLILTSVEAVVQESDDGQDESRFLTLEVRRTDTQMKEIRSFIQGKHPDIKNDLEVIYAMWTLIIPRDVTIHKTIEMDIPIREFKRYLTLVQDHALLCNRTTTNDADFKAIDDFLSYSKPMINSTTPAFTRKEAAVRSCLSQEKKSMGDISAECKMSLHDVYRAVHGRKGTFQNPSGGLMAKEPKLEYTRVSTTGANDVHMVGLRS